MRLTAPKPLYAVAVDWNEYQEKSADLFRTLGLEAETNVTLQGVRGKHDGDVVVRSKVVGIELLWLVECKHWQRRVSKLHVAALTTIINDVGADRGVILAEKGYQSGAKAMAETSNITLTSLAELDETTGLATDKTRLANIAKRIDECERRYWSHSKAIRIAYELRGHYSKDIYDLKSYYATWLMDEAWNVYHAALSGALPVRSVKFRELSHVRTLSEAVTWLDNNITELEERLDIAEELMKRRGHFDPTPISGPLPREIMQRAREGDCTVLGEGRAPGGA